MHGFSGIGFYPVSSLPEEITILENEVFLTVDCDIASTAIREILRDVTFTVSSWIDSGIGTIFEFLTLDTLGNFDSAAGQDFPISLDFSATVSETSLGGLEYVAQRALQALVDQFSENGFVYERDNSLDATSGFDGSEEYFKEVALSLDTTSTDSYESIYDGVASFNFIANATESFTSTNEIPEQVNYNAVGEFLVENLYDFLIIETVTATFSRVAENSISRPQNELSVALFNVEASAVFNRTVEQTLSLNQSIRLLRDLTNQADNLTFSQSITATKIRNVSLSQTLTFSQVQYGFRGISDLLNLNQTIVAVVSKSVQVSQQLNLTQTVARNISIVIAVNQTLEFETPRLVDGPFSYWVIPYNYNLVPRKCLVILSTNKRSIVLPCPVFGDSQAYQGELTVKRTMTGSTRTYVRRTILEKLEYSFDLWTEKYLELEDFYRNSLDSIIRIDNWKGETWLTYITNNPIEFTAIERFQPKGERYTVALEFQGIKVNG